MAGSGDAQALLLTVSADTSKALKAIDNLNKRLAGVAPEMQRSAKKAAEGVEREFEGINVGKALRKVFDASRFQVVEEGSAKLRVFGSAIEPLGPLGIAAAAGVVALSEALHKSREAIEYADSLYKAAAAAHVSTDALQEFRQAVEKAGGDGQAAGPALLAFSETLGKAQEGLAKGLRGFQALGFSPEQVKRFKDTEEALDAIVARIQNLRSRSQQDAAISQFGLQGLAPLILAGAEAWRTWREDAKTSGEVLDKEVIRRAHDLSVQMDELTGKIKNELTTAFVDLGPVLVDILKLTDKLLNGVDGFARRLGELARDPKIQALIETSLGSVPAESAKRFGLGFVADFAGKPMTMAEMQAALGPAKKGNGVLKDLSKKPKAEDQTAAFDKTALDALNSGREALAKAMAALTDGILAHAEAEKDAIDKGLQKKLDDLEAEAQKIAKAKNDADKLAQRAKINAAKAAEQEAAEIQKRVVDQKAATLAMEQFLSYAQRIHADYARIASNSAAMADTAAQRNAIERAQLLKEQRDELDAFDKRAKDELSKLTGPERDDRESQLKAERQTKLDRFASDQAKQAYDQAGPVERYARSIQDLNTEVQNDAVSAFQNLTSGLIDAALHARNLGDVAKNVFLTLIQDILTQTLQKNALPGLEAGASGLLAVLGLASGGPVRGPGSSTSDSIPAMLSDGEFVVKASAASKHRALLEAINNGGVPKLANGGFVSAPSFPLLDAIGSMRAPAASTTISAPAFYDLRGALIDKDVYADMNRIAAAHASKAGQIARAGAVQDVQRAGYLGNLNQ